MFLSSGEIAIPKTYDERFNYGVSLHVCLCFRKSLLYVACGCIEKKLSLLLLFNERVVRYFDLIKPYDPIDVPKISAANVRWNEEYWLHGSSHALLPPLVREFSE